MRFPQASAPSTPLVHMSMEIRVGFRKQDCGYDLPLLFLGGQRSMRVGVEEGFKEEN